MYSGNIKGIELGLENCESIFIERKYIGRFCLRAFERQIARMGCNYIGDTSFANEILIEIHAGANKKEVPTFGGDERCRFDRLLGCNDITSITMVQHDGSETFVVDYNEGDDAGSLGANNIYQKSKLNDFGDLYVVIGEKLDVDIEFPTETINDEDHGEFMWKMYGLEEEGI